MFEKFKRYPVFTKVLIVTCAVVLVVTVGCVIAVIVTGGF